MVVSTTFAVVSVVVVVGTPVVVVTTVGLEVTTVVSLLVVVAGTEVVVSRRSVVEAIVGPAVTTFCGFVVDRVLDVVACFVVVSTGFAVVSAILGVGKLVVLDTT